MNVADGAKAATDRANNYSFTEALRLTNQRPIAQTHFLFHQNLFGNIASKLRRDFTPRKAARSSR
jgi:hypothetical protein